MNLLKEEEMILKLVALEEEERFEQEMLQR